MPGDRTGIRTDRPPAAQTVARIENRARLTDHGDQELRAAVLDLAEAALAALSPSAGLRRSVRLDGENLVAGGRSYDLAAVGRLVVLGAGKASAELPPVNTQMARSPSPRRAACSSRARAPVTLAGPGTGCSPGRIVSRRRDFAVACGTTTTLPIPGLGRSRGSGEMAAGSRSGEVSTIGR